MLLLPPSPPVRWPLRAVSTSRTHSQARELRAGACVGSSRVGHVSVMASETLVRAGARGRLVVLEAAMRGGKRSDGLSVSMVLTSQAHRRRTPKKNRRIPTIPTGRFGGRLVHVSAVDTVPRGSESAGFLVAEPGAVAVWNHRHSCLRPCVVCRTQPPPPGGPSALPLLSCYGRSPAPATWVPSHVTNVMTSNIELYLAPARKPAGHGSTPALP